MVGLECVAVAMIGLVQVVAGAAVLVLTAGCATVLANALIAEGIGDMIYATQAGLRGTFSWKEWGEQKAISMVISIATAGVGAHLSMGAKAAGIGIKVATSSIMKAVAKKVLGKFLETVIMKIASEVADKLAKLATNTLFNYFRENFRSWVRCNAMAQNSINQCKTELTRLIQYYGQEQAAQYLIAAVQKSMTDSDLQNSIGGQILSHAINVADKFGDNLQIAGDRLKYSSSNTAKLMGSISKVIDYSVKAAKVTAALAEIAAVVPLAFKYLSNKLQHVRLKSAQAHQRLTSYEEASVIAEQLMQEHAVNQILDRIQSITETRIVGAAFSEALSHGVKPLN